MVSRIYFYLRQIEGTNIFTMLIDRMSSHICTYIYTYYNIIFMLNFCVLMIARQNVKAKVLENI